MRFRLASRRRVTAILVLPVLSGGLLVYMVLTYQSAWRHVLYPSVSATTTPVTPRPPRVDLLPRAAAAPPVSVPDYILPPITDGLAPVLSRIPTKQPVVFLGIDDGVTKLPGDLKMMKDNYVKASLFLTHQFIQDDLNFFKGFVAAGSLIENHTIDHTLFTNLTYEQQKQQICDQADLLEQEYGRRPTLFRPPGGIYNLDTQRAAADCGMKAVVLWIAKANGGSMQYQQAEGLQAGDIVLMHFRPEFASDMQSFIDACEKAGLHTELLENWTSP